MRAALVLSIGAVLLALGCRRGESAPSEPASTDAATEAAAPGPPPLDLRLAWSRLPLLPPGVEPKGWPEALRAWETATTAYAAGDVRDASAAFISVAATLRDNAAGAAARVATTGRCLAYENAGRALEAGHDVEGAIALLERSAAEDPACKHSVALRVARLQTARTSSAAVRRAGTP